MTLSPVTSQQPDSSSEETGLETLSTFPKDTELLRSRTRAQTRRREKWTPQAPRWEVPASREREDCGQSGNSSVIMKLWILGTSGNIPPKWWTIQRGLFERYLINCAHRTYTQKPGPFPAAMQVPNSLPFVGSVVIKHPPSWGLRGAWRGQQERAAHLALGYLEDTRM